MKTIYLNTFGLLQEQKPEEEHIERAYEVPSDVNVYLLDKGDFEGDTFLGTYYHKRLNQNKIATLNSWFKWYDNQVSQATRAQRTGVEWHANDGTRTYYSLAELDADANAKQSEIRALKQAHGL